MNPPFIGCRVKSLMEHFKGLGSKLVTLRDTPHAIAGGVAIGVFVGFTPLFGIKTLLSLGGAYLLRCNPIAAVIAVSLHDIVTPLWPVLLRIEYDIGYWLLSHPHHFPPKMEMHHIHVSEMLKWTTFLPHRVSASARFALPCGSGGRSLLLRAPEIFTGAASATRRDLRWRARMKTSFSPCGMTGTRR